jgi:hypothetical protein
MVPQIARRHRMFPPARLLFSGGGMTVLEVIVALFFFTVGVLAVTGMQVIGMRSSVDAAIRGANCILAGDTIEKILSLPYTDPRLDDPDAGFHPDHPDYGPHPIQPSGGTVEWEVDIPPGAANFKRIFITLRESGVNGSTLVQSYHYLKPKCPLTSVSRGENRAP